MGHEISVWNIPSGITGLPFQMFVAPKHFSLERPKKWCSISLQPDFPKNFVNGKQPMSTKTCSHCARVAQNPFRKMTILGAVQLRSVTEIAPKSPFLCVNRSPNRNGFRLGATASLKIQLPNVNSWSFVHQFSLLP